MSDNLSSNKRIARNSIFLSIRMVFVLGITLYTTRAILQILGVEDYGVYNVVCGFVSMFAFLNTSMANGIQRFYNYEFGKNGDAGANRVYCTALLIQSILAVVVVVLTESFGLWYLHHKMVIPEERMLAAEWIFQFSVLSFLFVIMQAPYTAAVMAHERMDFYAVVSVFDAVLKLAIVFAVPYLSGDRLVGYGLLLALISVLNFALYYWYCKKNFVEITFRRLHKWSLFRPMLGFSGWNMFGSFGGLMKEQGINLVLNFYFGPVVNASRGVALQVNAGLQSFVGNITMPVRPQVVQSYAKGDMHRAMSLTYSISKLSCCFLVMMAIPVSLEIHYILALWLGDNVPPHTSTLTVIVVFTSITSNLNSALSNIVHATGQMKNYQLWGSLINMSSVPIAFILLSRWNIPELALITVMLCGIVAHTISLFVVRNLVGLSIIDYTLRVVLPVLIVIVITLAVALPFHYLISTGFIRLVVVTFISIASICLSLFYVAFNGRERLLARQFLASAVQRIGCFINK